MEYEKNTGRDGENDSGGVATGEMYKTIVDRTGVSETTIGRVARENGICRIKRNIEKVKDNYPQELLDEWDRVRLEILRKG